MSSRVRDGMMKDISLNIRPYFLEARRCVALFQSSVFITAASEAYHHSYLLSSIALVELRFTKTRRVFAELFDEKALRPID